MTSPTGTTTSRTPTGGQSGRRKHASAFFGLVPARQICSRVTATRRCARSHHMSSMTGSRAGVGGSFCLNNRYYDPVISRFVSVDPIVARSRDAYGYGGNNPIKYSDPTGLEKDSWFDNSDVAWAYGYLREAGATSPKALNEQYDNAKNVWTMMGEGNGESGRMTHVLNAVLAERTGKAPMSGLSPFVMTIATMTWGMAGTAGGGGSMSSGTAGLKPAPALAPAATEATEGVAGGGTAIEPYYPANNGFSGSPAPTELQPGALFDRYGSDFGRFASPEGTPMYQRALPPGAEDGAYSAFRVIKPLTVDAGKIAPAFGSFGGGTQYVLPNSIKVLLESGVIERVMP